MPQLFVKKLSFHQKVEYTHRLESFREGTSNEVHFLVDMLAEARRSMRPLQVCKTLQFEDQSKHIDCRLKTASGSLMTFDVKGRKRNSRLDQSFQSTDITVELQIDRSKPGKRLVYPGWVFGEQTFIAFNTKDSEWWLVRPSKLRNLILPKIQSGTGLIPTINQEFHIPTQPNPIYIKKATLFGRDEIKTSYTPYTRYWHNKQTVLDDILVDVPIADLESIVSKRVPMSYWDETWKFNHIQYSDLQPTYNGRYTCNEYIDADSDFIDLIKPTCSCNGTPFLKAKPNE